jgi:hypothetical protein
MAIRDARRGGRLALVAFALLTATATGALGAPVAVRTPEVPVYGTLSLSMPGGEALARGEISQTVQRDRVESRLTFWFKDGSLLDEVVSFTQDRVFRLISYRMVQRGRAFPQDIEIAFDRDRGRYAVRTRAKPGDSEERLEGAVEMPADLCNGMAWIITRHLDGANAECRMLAFAPRPRLLRMEFVHEGTDSFWPGATAREASRYLVKIEVTGLLGVAAALIGREPPDLRYWIARQPVPTFLRFEGAFFLNGPVWRVELAPARWTP